MTRNGRPSSTLGRSTNKLKFNNKDYGKRRS